MASIPFVHGEEGFTVSLLSGPPLSVVTVTVAGGRSHYAADADADPRATAGKAIICNRR